MPPPIPSPSAICTVNGNVLSDINTSGINVAPSSTITIALSSVAGVNSWSIVASQADDLTQINGNLVNVNNSKIVTGFTATFVVPPMIDPVPNPGGVTLTRGNAVQFTSVVNQGEPNEHVFTFGVFVLNEFGNRLFFGSESFESNATVGNAADLNSMLTIFPFAYGGDLCGFTLEPRVESISGCPYGSPVIVNTHSLLGALNGNTTALFGSDGVDLTIAAQNASSPFHAGNINLDSFKLILNLDDNVGSNTAVSWAPGAMRLTGTASSFSVFAGPGQGVNGLGSDIALYGGDGSTSGTFGNGGVISLRSGAPGGVNASSGAISIFAPPGGVNGFSGDINIQSYGGSGSLNGNILISTPRGYTNSGTVKLESEYVKLQGGATLGSVNVLSGSRLVVDSPSTFNAGVLFNAVTATFDGSIISLDSSFIEWEPGTPPIFRHLALNLSSDANYTLLNTEYNYIEILVTSAVPLTATRNLVFPLGTGGEIYVITNKTSGGQSIQVIGATGVGVTIASGSTTLVWSDGTNYYGVSGSGGGGSVTWADDLAGSNNIDQWVAAISGSGGSGGTVPLNITTLQFASGQSTPKLTQATTSSATGQAMTISAQPATGASHNGGSLILAGGTSGSASTGTVVLKTGGTTALTVNAAGTITLASLGTGVVQSDSSGNLTSSTVPAAQITPGTSAQVLLSNATPTATWTTLSGDATVGATGVVAVTKVNGITISGTPAIGNQPVATSTSAASWASLNLAGGANYVTGLLPAANQDAQTMAGDVNGTTATSTVAKIQGNTVTSGALVKGQLFIASSTSNWAATDFTGDVSNSNATAGLTTVIGIRGKTLATSLASVGATQDGYVLTWVNGSTDWEAKPSSGGGGGGSITWANDLSGSTSTNQYVAAISGSAGAGGTVPLNITTLQFANGQSSPAFNQAALSATNTPTTGQNLTIKPQAGSNALSGNNNGGTGGNLVLSSGVGGTHTGSGSDGAVGNVTIQTAGVDDVIFGAGHSYHHQQFQNQNAVVIDQITPSGTGSQNGWSFTVQSQNGQQQSGGSANTNGGDLFLKAGVPGTGGSGGAGAGGGVKIVAGDSLVKLNVLAGGILMELANAGGSLQIDRMNTNNGVLLNNASGVITSGYITNSNIATGAGIDPAKFQAGTANQVLINNATPTPTWTTLSGDATNVLGVITNIGIRGKTLASSLASVGAAQDGYVLTWVDGSSDWEAKPQTGGGGGSFTAGGDLSGTSSSQNVIALHSATTSVNVGSATAPSSGQVLTATSSTAATWQTPSSGGITALTGDVTASGTGSVAATIKTMQATTTATKTANYTITTSDFQIFANPSGAFNLTLPAPANGMRFEVWDISGTMETNNVTLVRNGSEKISGVAASRVLSTNWGHWVITTNGTDWFISG